VLAQRCRELLLVRCRVLLGLEMNPRGGGLLGPGAIAIRGKLVAPFVSQRIVAVEGEGNEADLAASRR
jgi:hypothetical protein